MKMWNKIIKIQGFIDAIITDSCGNYIFELRQTNLTKSDNSLPPLPDNLRIYADPYTNSRQINAIKLDDLVEFENSTFIYEWFKSKNFKIYGYRIKKKQI
jgi:hypothetical protein